MKKILWIVDVLGWAYHNRATVLAKEMPQYEHHFMEYPKAGFMPILFFDPHLIVCPDPRILCRFIDEYKGPTVLIANAPKLFRINLNEPCSLEYLCLPS